MINETVENMTKMMKDKEALRVAILNALWAIDTGDIESARFLLCQAINATNEGKNENTQWFCI